MGRDFAQLAKEHSKDPGSKDQGGELGFFTRGQMVPQFEEAAFKLKKGEVGEPFESQFGWHIVRVDDRRQRAAPPFEAVKDRVVAAMIHKKAQQIAGGLEGQGSDRVHRSGDQELDGERARRRAAEAMSGRGSRAVREEAWHGQDGGEAVTVRARAAARDAGGAGRAAGGLRGRHPLRRAAPT